MKVSEITLDTICEHCRIDQDDLTDSETALVTAMKTAAVQYCAGQTGMTAEKLDEHEDITIAVLCLISDMYDNRQMYVDKRFANRTVDTILGMHCMILVEGTENGD